MQFNCICIVYSENTTQPAHAVLLIVCLQNLQRFVKTLSRQSFASHYCRLVLSGILANGSSTFHPYLYHVHTMYTSLDVNKHFSQHKQLHPLNKVVVNQKLSGVRVLLRVLLQRPLIKAYPSQPSVMHKNGRANAGRIHMCPASIPATWPRKAIWSLVITSQRMAASHGKAHQDRLQ